MKSKLTALLVSASGVASIPLLAFAQNNACIGVDYGTIQYIVCQASDILRVLLPFLIGLAIIVFIWGVIQYVISNDEEAKTKGRNMMIFGIIGIAAIVALWGLVAIVIGTFGVPSAEFEPPTLFPQ